MPCKENIAIYILKMRKLSLKEGEELAHSYTANKGQSWGLFALKIRSLYTTAWDGGAGEASFGLWGFIAPGKGRNEEMIQRNDVNLLLLLYLLLA